MKFLLNVLDQLLKIIIKNWEKNIDNKIYNKIKEKNQNQKIIIIKQRNEINQLSLK